MSILHLISNQSEKRFNQSEKRMDYICVGLKSADLNDLCPEEKPQGMDGHQYS
jgi:hypothetical protein